MAEDYDAIKGRVIEQVNGMDLKTVQADNLRKSIVRQLQ